MRLFFEKYKYFLALLLIFFIAEVIVHPLGNYPLNDDWSYAKSVLKFLNEGKLEIGDWPAMTLATHILWGFVFTKAFGFSFLVLRISTWVSVLIALWFLNKLVIRINGNPKVAFVVCLTLLFNPVFFNVSNTYMTDINFLTLTLLCAYCGYDFFTRPRLPAFVLTFVLGLALVLLRQYGIIVPVCMTVSCFFLKEKKFVYLGLGFALTVLTYMALLWYESYLKTILPSYAAYKYSGGINPTRRLFWDYLWYGITTRYKIVMIHALFYTFPLLLIFLPKIFAGIKKQSILILLVVVAVIVYFLYLDYPLQVGNVFLDTAVGTDTSYETLVGTYGLAPHFYSRQFELLITPFKYLLITLSLVLVILLLFKHRSQIIEWCSSRPGLIYFFCLFFSYLVMILITETFFDRYQLPVILLSLIIYSFINKQYPERAWLSFIPLLFLFYFSVLGTKDYFVLNDRKWEAYHTLTKKESVPPEKINGGFELMCWNEGKPSAWYEFMFLYKQDFLIQYKREDSFALYREYPFRRYFPYKMDTLRVFKRTIFRNTEAGKDVR